LTPSLETFKKTQCDSTAMAGCHQPPACDLPIEYFLNMETKNKRLKVLISAYACNPYQGSEWGVGWGWVKAISAHHDVWVITDTNNRKALEKKMSERPERYARIHFHYLPRSYYPRLTKLWMPTRVWTYNLWQKEAGRFATVLHEKVGFDLVHLVTFVGFRSPGLMWRMDIPFVWGPIGGMENTKWCFLPSMGLKGCLHFTTRNFINSFQKRFLRAPKLAFKKASGSLIAATGGIRNEILKCYGQKSAVICEIGPPNIGTPKPVARGGKDALLLSWSGVHVPRKSLPFLLHALARLPGDLDWRLSILGSGPCTKKWQKLAQRLGLAKKCHWHGWLPRKFSMAIVGCAHVFVITSMQELTATVTLEAISQGVPIICPDYCGYGEVVNETCGIKIPLSSPSRFIEDLAEAIETLGRDEPMRRRLAEGALKRIHDFSWEKKALQVNEIYKTALDPLAADHLQAEKIQHEGS
jgi:glycosyltransferase involved in cell wall biosynthesis